MQRSPGNGLEVQLRNALIGPPDFYESAIHVIVGTCSDTRQRANLCVAFVREQLLWQ